MNKEEEKKALKVFKKATQNLFNEKVDEAYYDFNRVISMFPDTHLAFKSRILNCIIWKITLFCECILTETFSQGLKAIKINPILDIFNKDRMYFVNNYEAHSSKRMKAFTNLKKELVTLIELEKAKNYPIVHMYINLSAERMKGIDPFKELDEVRDGNVISDKVLRDTIKDLYYYILVTSISDDFDIEYTDKLSSLSKHKLNRIDLYHSFMTWLEKFYQIEQHYQTGDLIRHCCVIVLGLTDDTANCKRQQAYEAMSRMSKDYYSMALSKEDVEETKVADIEEELFEPQFNIKDMKVSSLIDIVQLDVADDPCGAGYVPTPYSPLALELELEPPGEILQAKEELGEDDEEHLDSSFASKLEFD